MAVCCRLPVLLSVSTSASAQACACMFFEHSRGDSGPNKKSIISLYSNNDDRNVSPFPLLKSIEQTWPSSHVLMLLFEGPCICMEA